MTVQEQSVSIEQYIERIEELHARGLSDGVTVIPPTPEDVDAMIAASGRRAEEVVGRLASREVSVHDVAEQAVMAGCLPAYAPVVVAAVEALTDPAMKTVEHLESTAGLVPVTVVCGPIGPALKLNSGRGAFGPSFRANAAIGRAIRLALRNLAGGTLARATLGNGYAFSCVVADDEASFPFTPLQTTFGLGADASAVVVMWATAPRMVNHLNSGDASALLRNAADQLASLTHFERVPPPAPGRERGLFVLSYDFQEILQQQGWDRRRVQEFLAENTGRRAGDARAAGLGGSPFIPKDVADDAFLRFYPRPEDIVMVRAGAPGGVGQSTMARVFGLAARAIAVPAASAPAVAPLQPGTMAAHIATVHKYLERGLSDGWPVVPPTAGGIDRMVEASRRRADEVLGKFTYSDAVATVKDIAVNALMAGCTPEQMPLVVAAFEMCIPHGAPASVGSWSPWLVVNGPAARRMGLLDGGAPFGPGNRAATAIGRALRMGIMNIGRHRPDVIDKAVQGQGWKFTITTFAEDAEASPWEPLHVTLGYKPEDNLVTFVTGALGHLETTYTGSDPEAFLRVLADDLSREDPWLTPTQPPGYYAPRRAAFIVMSPDHRRILQSAGWSRERARTFLHEHTGRRLGEIRALGFEWPGRFPPDWTDDTFVRALPGPEAVTIVAAGRAGPHTLSSCMGGRLERATATRSFA